MDSNSELLLSALRYFNDNRHEDKTRVGLEKYLNVFANGANNILHDLEISKCVEKKSTDPEIWQITPRGEQRINELQKTKDSESIRTTIWSAAVIIGIIQIIIGVIQIYLASDSCCPCCQETVYPPSSTYLFEQSSHSCPYCHDH